MIEKNIEQLVEDQQTLLNEVKQLKRDHDFYLRILVQAVLTNDGILEINPAYSEEATKKMKNVQLEFGNGKVCFHKEKGSIFS